MALRYIEQCGIQICYNFKYTMNNIMSIVSCELIFCLFWLMFVVQNEPVNVVPDGNLFFRSRLKSLSHIVQLTHRHCVNVLR